MVIKKYKIYFTVAANKEIEQICRYLEEVLFAENAVVNLKIKIEEKIKCLENNPRMYSKIQKKDDLNREYRKIVINHYIVLYTIDEERKTIYISHCYYNASDYLTKM